MILTSCSTDDKKEVKHTGFIINGTLFSNESTFVYLLNDQNVKIDSSVIKNNSFHFKGSLKTPQIHRIQVDNSPNKHSLILENNTFSVFINNKDFTIIGGALNAKKQSFEALKKQLNDKKLALLDSFMVQKITDKQLQKAVKQLNTELKKTNTEYIISNAHNLLPIHLLNASNPFNLEDLKNIRNNIKKLKNNHLTTFLDNEITRLQNKSDAELRLKKQLAATKKAYRKPAIMFSGDGINRELISLETIIKGKKAVLIDFWASWCGPCRMVTPRVREIYAKYKNKGFTILTISEDKNREDWKKGIEQDKMLSWHHIFDDFGRISSMYGVKSIPYMVLIDGNGGIIKEKISISELENQLQKIL